MAPERVAAFVVARRPTTLGETLYAPYRDRLLREDEVALVFLEPERLEGRTPTVGTPRLTVEPP